MIKKLEEADSNSQEREIWKLINEISECKTPTTQI